MGKYFIFVLFFIISFGLSGCSLLKSERKNIPPPEPRLDYKQNESIKKVAKINHELAMLIREHGIKPNEEMAILLEDGTYAILKFTGEPYEDIDVNDLKKDRKLINRGNDVAEDFQKERSKFSDELHERREDLIRDVNLKWDWKKILGGGVITWVAIAVAIPILSAFFPVIIPFVSLFWQILKTGLSSFKIIAQFGVSGLVKVIKSVEEFRDSHKGTSVGQAFDDHMKKTLDIKEKASLDQFKNHFDI